MRHIHPSIVTPVLPLKCATAALTSHSADTHEVPESSAFQYDVSSM